MPMKTFLKSLFAVFIFCVLLYPAVSLSADYPEPYGYVNDFAKVITDRDEKIIAQYASILEERTSAQLAVVTVKTTSPESIESYAVELFERWGIGKKDKDNGILLLVAIKDRKTRIEVGYGLEGVITDALASRIINEVMITEFKGGSFSTGLKNGATAIVSIIAENQGLHITGQESFYHTSLQQTASPFAQLIQFILFMLFFLLIVGTRSGILGYLLFGSLYSRRRRRGYWSTSHGGFGGGFGGGGFSGGFGGFGGGMSGGGGASGGW